MTVGDDLPLFSDSLPWEDAQAALEALDLGDGLPLVPPTLGRFDAMISGRGAIGQSFGHVMPLMGDLTLEGVAYNCILAGCQPNELPVVLTAAVAAIEDRFNLLGVLSTTGTPAVAVCVHGPIVVELGLNAGGNILGPGNRANACIGRAVSLIMRNVGGARAGIADMATMGQPGKYTFCFAERSHDGFPSLPVRRGFGARLRAASDILNETVDDQDARHLVGIREPDVGHELRRQPGLFALFVGIDQRVRVVVLRTHQLARERSAPGKLGQAEGRGVALGHRDGETRLVEGLEILPREASRQVEPAREPADLSAHVRLIAVAQVDGQPCQRGAAAAAVHEPAEAHQPLVGLRRVPDRSDEGPARRSGPNAAREL